MSSETETNNALRTVLVEFSLKDGITYALRKRDRGARGARSPTS